MPFIVDGRDFETKEAYLDFHKKRDEEYFKIIGVTPTETEETQVEEVKDENVVPAVDPVDVDPVVDPIITDPIIDELPVVPEVSTEVDVVVDQAPVVDTILPEVEVNKEVETTNVDTQLTDKKSRR